MTLDADTLLHKKAVNNIVARILSSPSDVCAVAGHVLARNSRDNILTRMQEWDYFLGIASLKRMQGLYQGTLVAQGAFSLYKTDVVREVGGWDDVIGEDIVLTWKFFEKGYRVFFEPLAIAFTEVPNRFKHFTRQRSRWARGMLEGLKKRAVETGEVFGHLFAGNRYFDTINRSSIHYILDTRTCIGVLWKYYIVGPYTLLVLPLNVLVTVIMYSFKKYI